MNKIVVRYADGNILKGFTSDFAPNRPSFHLTSRDHQKTEVIFVKKLKAVFIVKTFEGDPDYKDHSSHDESQRVYGTKFNVIFTDGEELSGIATGYSPEKSGFFLTPFDSNSNIIRAYIVLEAVDHIDRI